MYKNAYGLVEKVFFVSEASILIENFPQWILCL